MDYTIRRSPRARHVWLKLSGSGDLVVVVPRRFDVNRVPGVVASNREWIDRAASRVARRREAACQAEPVTLPDRIHFAATGQEWAVRYRMTGSLWVRVVEHSGGELDVSATGDSEACRRALVRWLYRVAKAHLVAMLREIAGDGGFTVGQVSVRSQRTRWASCSRKGTVCLNIRLLFVSPELVRHIMLHELCHTIRMDHSKSFWSLLEEYDPDWRSHRLRLRAAWHGVPAWVTTPIPSEL